MVTNISRKRAAVDEACINAYFDELARSLAGIVPSKIVNFDETGLTDDPGKKKCAVRRETRYQEMVKNHSKVNIGVMFSGAADGTLLPPYTVYKARSLYEQWKEGGLQGASYTTQQLVGLMRWLLRTGSSPSACPFYGGNLDREL